MDKHIIREHMLVWEVIARELYLIQLVIQILPCPQTWDYIVSLDMLIESGTHANRCTHSPSQPALAALTKYYRLVILQKAEIHFLQFWSLEV